MSRGKIVLLVFCGLVLLLVIAIGILAWRNRTLPTHSTSVEQLSELEKARLAEMFHLRKTLGNEVWPEWGNAVIPVIVYNEAYAFLIGYEGDTPPDGWVKVPQGEQLGGPWETVPGDTFQGQPYYRQPLANMSRTPENFTVLVGEQWVATLQTKEYSAIAFYQGFRSDLPDFLKPVFPYRLVWSFLIDSSETYISALCHEAFHAYQGHELPDRLAAAERVSPLEARYPWDDETAKEVWRAEVDVLHQAVKATDDDEAMALARQFLAQREARRALLGMTPDLVDYERQREWLEGLAKYAELSIGVQAERAANYEPVPAIADDPEFKNYTTRERYWSRQVDEVQRMNNREGEVRFYYTGMAQGVLLDRWMSDWKARVWQDGVWLEVLLAEAVGEKGE